MFYLEGSTAKEFYRTGKWGEEDGTNKEISTAGRGGKKKKIGEWTRKKKKGPWTWGRKERKERGQNRSGIGKRREERDEEVAMAQQTEKGNRKRERAR